MRRRPSTSALAVALWLTSSAASAVNPCVPVATDQGYHSSTLVFIGEVSGYIPVNAEGEAVAEKVAVGAVYTALTLEEFKGSGAKEYRINVIPPPSVLVYSRLLEVGNQYLLFASGERYRIDSCVSSELRYVSGDTLKRLRQLRDEHRHQQSSDVSSLFKALRHTITAEASAPIRKQPKDAIRLYATDDSNTKMCFISHDTIFIYSSGAIQNPLYAKAFNVEAVNRITYQKSDTGGVFHIWIDDELVLSIGS